MRYISYCPGSVIITLSWFDVCGPKGVFNLLYVACDDDKRLVVNVVAVGSRLALRPRIIGQLPAFTNDIPFSLLRLFRWASTCFPTQTDRPHRQIIICTIYNQLIDILFKTKQKESNDNLTITFTKSVYFSACCHSDRNQTKLYLLPSSPGLTATFFFFSSQRYFLPFSISIVLMAPVTPSPRFQPMVYIS